MGTFTPIAMKCTQEQFDAVKPKLKDCITTKIWCFDKFNYLANNCNGTERHIINVEYCNKDMYNRKVYEEWDEEIFLKACGIEFETLQDQIQKAQLEVERLQTLIEEENKPKEGDWYLIVDSNEIFKINKSHCLKSIYKHKDLYRKINNPELIKLLNDEIK